MKGSLAVWIWEGVGGTGRDIFVFPVVRVGFRGGAFRYLLTLKPTLIKCKNLTLHSPLFSFFFTVGNQFRDAFNFC